MELEETEFTSVDDKLEVKLDWPVVTAVFGAVNV